MLDDEKLAIISESTTTNLSVSDRSIQYVNIQDVISMEKFNSFQRLCTEVTINELNYSECLWLKFAQKELISNNSKYEKLRSSLKLYKDNTIY